LKEVIKMSNGFLESIFDLKNKVALVVGGGGELGKAMALGLAKAGAEVAIADINSKAARKVSEELLALNRESVGLEVDVTNSEMVNSMSDKVLDKFGHIDILINSAGISQHVPAHEMTDQLKWYIFLL